MIRRMALLVAAAGVLTAQEKMIDLKSIEKAELILEKEDQQMRQRFQLQVAPKALPKSDGLTLVLRQEDGTEELVPLHDDGTHGDLVAGDRIFTGITYAKPGFKERFFLRGLVGENQSAVTIQTVLFRW